MVLGQLVVEVKPYSDYAMSIIVTCDGYINIWTCDKTLSLDRCIENAVEDFYKNYARTKTIRFMKGTG